jgi:hypothetical protein
MRTTKTVILSTVMAISLASGPVSAQGDFATRPERPANSEIGAARQALEEALGHLRKVPDPQNRDNVRAMNFIKLAQQQLQAEGSLYPIN